MSTEELKEYLSIVVDMEKSLFLQDCLIKELETKIAGLGKVAQLVEPSAPHEQPLPEEIFPPFPYPPEKKSQKLVKRNFLITFLICLILSLPSMVSLGPFVWVISGAIVCTFFGSITAGITYLLYREKDISEENKYQSALAAFDSAVQEHQRACIRVEKNNQAAMDSYQNELEIYHSNVAEEQLRVKLENAEKSILAAELSKIRNANKASQDTLRLIYDRNIIFPKYRNLVMVCSLYEYICAGRCDTLEGHDGAYNILELEIRLDKVIVQLDRVISMLGRINHSQYLIYTTIQDANQQSAKILESTYQMANQLKEIQVSSHQINRNIQSSIQATEKQAFTMNQQLAALQESSSITAYQAERVQKELHYMNRINYLSGKNDDVFFNAPPM